MDNPGKKLETVEIVDQHLGGQGLLEKKAKTRDQV